MGGGGQAERGGEWAGELSVVQAPRAFVCHSRSDTSGTVLDEREWREEPGEWVLLNTELFNEHSLIQEIKDAKIPPRAM